MIITVEPQINWKDGIASYVQQIKKGSHVLETTELRFGESLALTRIPDGSGYIASGNSHAPQTRMCISFHQIITTGGRSIYIEDALASFVARDDILLLFIELPEQNLQITLWKNSRGLSVWAEDLTAHQPVREIPERQTA